MKLTKLDGILDTFYGEGKFEYGTFKFIIENAKVTKLQVDFNKELLKQKNIKLDKKETRRIKLNIIDFINKQVFR
jgi:hypothetical protein